MRRNDLTTEEVRVERLLRTLSRDSAAPDPEFLRTLREASTKAFLAAQANQPQPRRVQTATPTDPALGRRLLRTLRIAMLSAVAVLLTLGALPPSIFPSRGVELQVALDNLRRNETVEIEVQNGRVSNTLLYASTFGDERLAFTYPSGNWEVIQGGSAAFVNFGNNSIHPSPPDVAEVSLNLLEDKLMSSLSVNDPQVKSLLLSQRPQSQRAENGQLFNYYHFQSPAALGDGETLNVDATVNALTNSLVTMNSKVIDSAGNVRFEANADVKSLNTAIPLDRFQVDLHAEALDQIAMVEDVQGNVEVLDGAASQVPPGVYDNGARSYWNFQDGAILRNDLITQGAGLGFGRARALASDGVLGGGLPGQQFAGVSGVQPTFEQAQSEDLAKRSEGNEFLEKPASGMLAKGGQSRTRAIDAAAPQREGSAKKESATAPLGAVTADEPAPVKLMPKATAQDPVQRKTNAAESKAPASRPGEPDAPPPGPPAVANKSRQAVAENAPIPFSKAGPTASNRVQMEEQKVGAKPAASPSPLIAKGRPPAPPNPAPRAEDEQQLKQQMPSRARYSAPSQRSPRGGMAQTGKGASPGAVQLEGEHLAEQTTRQSPLMDDKTALTIPPRANADRPDAQQLQNAPQLGQRGVEYADQLGQFQGGYGGYASRLAEANSELRPGEMLKTGDDPTNVVRARLANDANLIVGPGSEVLLLKPTEVRLRFGEVALEVPEGDQVDLLGPEPELQLDPENYKLNLRRSAYQSRGMTRQRQVTGTRVYSVQKNQLQELEQQPEWLTKYYARYNKTDSQKGYPLRAKVSGKPDSANQPEGVQKAAAPVPAAESPQKKN